MLCVWWASGDLRRELGRGGVALLQILPSSMKRIGGGAVTKASMHAEGSVVQAEGDAEGEGGEGRAQNARGGRSAAGLNRKVGNWRC